MGFRPALNQSTKTEKAFGLLLFQSTKTKKALGLLHFELEIRIYGFRAVHKHEESIWLIASLGLDPVGPVNENYKSIWFIAF